MPLRTVLELPDPRLREHARPVSVFDDELRALATDLVETLHASGAIGLCAPQLGDPRTVLVMDLSGDRSAPEVYVNPRILGRSTFGIVEERCLSVPGVVVNVLRATRVRVEAFDPTGARFERELEGMRAVCLQHEMDHFAGKLLVDKLWWLARRRVMAAAKRRAAEAEARA